MNKVTEEHTEWTTEFFRWVFEQAFEHGYKHGYEKEIIRLIKRNREADIESEKKVDVLVKKALKLNKEAQEIMG